MTSTVPAEPAGELTVREVPLPFTTTFVPAFTPKFTAVAPVRLVPVTVTEVPPASGPPEGLTFVTVGVDAAAAGLAVKVPTKGTTTKAAATAADAPNTTSLLAPPQAITAN